MSAYKIQTPGNYPEENIQHTEHGESLKSRISGMAALTRNELILSSHLCVGRGTSEGWSHVPETLPEKQH
jgi:hypothetical protein